MSVQADRWVVAGCAVLLVALSLGVHAVKYPDFSGFWAGTDQHRLLLSAQAWSMLDTAPGSHHYLPYYPLFGALFVWLTPWQPFMLPDAACLAGALLVFVRIGHRLAPGWPGCVPALCCVVAVLGGPHLLAIWVVPWSTTGSAPFQMSAVLLALRLGERVCGRRAFELGLAIGIVAGFRPSDAAVLFAGCGSYALCALVQRDGGWREGAGLVLAGAAGCVTGALPAVAAHLAVFGARLGPYIAESASIGFEWRLLPLRWVLLVVDPRPLLPEGRGMAEMLPWIVPGLAGLVYTVLPRDGHRGGPAILAAGIVGLHWASYLAYRDMHPYGLWRFYNVHYFKWTFPFLVLWATQFAAALVRRPERLRATLAGLAVLPLFTLRPVLADPLRVPIVSDGHGIVLGHGLSRLDRAVWLPLSGSWSSLYLGAFTLHEAGEDFVNKRDIKVMPMLGGALLVPLRPLPPGPAILDLPPGVGVETRSTMIMAHQSIVLGLPCGVFWRAARCGPSW